MALAQVMLEFRHLVKLHPTVAKDIISALMEQMAHTCILQRGQQHAELQRQSSTESVYRPAPQKTPQVWQPSAEEGSRRPR